MKFSIQEGLLPGQNLKEKVKNLKKYGFDSIEIWGRNLDERKDEIKKVLSSEGIEFSAICSGYRGTLLSDDKEERSLASNGIKKLLTVGETLGAVGLIVVPIFGNPKLPDLSPYKSAIELEKELLVEILGELSRTAEKTGVKILLEPLNRYETHFLNRLEQAVEICKTVGSEGVKIMADFFHMNIEEDDIRASVEKFMPFIYHFHLADSNRLLPGQGHTDFKKAFDSIKSAGYKYHLSLECGIKGDPDIELPRCAKFLKEL